MSNVRKVEMSALILNWHRLVTNVLPAVALVIFVSPGQAQELFSQQSQILVDNNSRTHYYESNHDIESSGNTLTRIIVLVHGAGRTNITFERVLEAAVMNGVESETLIFAPQFLVEDDVARLGLGSDVLFWPNGWRQGHLSRDNGLGRISSFALTNRIVSQIVINNPSVADVVIAGHSAGGQYAQRFAATSDLEQQLAAIVSGIRVRYVPANPSSSVYMDNTRRVGDSIDEFAVPDSTSCPEYDDYKYGLGGNFNSYVNSIGGAAQVRAQYPERDVRFIIGEDDNDPNSSSLGTSCESNFQGTQRYERGVVYYNHLREFFGDAVHDRHSLSVIANLGHTSSVFTAECGIYFLFDIGECALTTPTHLESSVATSGAVSLTWTDPASGESDYQVLRSDDVGDSYQVIATLSADASSYTDSTASSNTEYRYRVRVSKDGSPSGPSNTTVANAGASPPPVVVSPPPSTPPPPPASSSSGGGGAIDVVILLWCFIRLFGCRLAKSPRVLS